jgi:hypothetical protein
MVALWALAFPSSFVKMVTGVSSIALSVSLTYSEAQREGTLLFIEPHYVMRLRTVVQYRGPGSGCWGQWGTQREGQSRLQKQPGVSFNRRGSPWPGLSKELI